MLIFCIIVLSHAEQTRIQTRKQHRINKQKVCVEVMPQVPPQEDTAPANYDTLEVTNLPNEASEEYLELYFNSPKCGGCDDAVKSVAIVQPGMARVQFHDPQGNYQ